MIRTFIALAFGLVLACGCGDEGGSNSNGDGGPTGGGVTDGPVDGGMIGTPSLAGMCSADQWCWQNPLPQGDDLNDVWVLAEDHVLHRTAAGWGPPVNLDTVSNNRSLWDIYAVSANDVWIFGDRGTVLRNQWTWAAVSTGLSSGEDLRGVFGVAGHVYMAGMSSTLLHWDGSGFVNEPTPPNGDRFLAVGGSSPSDVWFVGERGLVRRYDAQGWHELRQVAFDTSDTITGMWGSSQANIVAKASQGVFSYDGTPWTKIGVSRRRPGVDRRHRRRDSA